ncbi:hypothetical protein [Vibrio phage YC]|uniref:Uncharacterized protein n=1 Tax=Vibrio phage YC TaxID=2267403 RepID=A0A384ZSB1_9CAUD|nr:hypothetical protein HWB64_gp160 [Vibrio phage YC]AXC34529.1 hypothetical protein [Vibrio phage YC]
MGIKVEGHNDLRRSTSNLGCVDNINVDASSAARTAREKRLEQKRLLDQQSEVIQSQDKQLKEAQQTIQEQADEAARQAMKLRELEAAIQTLMGREDSQTDNVNQGG